MTQEEELYYDNFFSLFSTDGWKQFLLESEAILNEQTIEDIKNLEELYSIQGQRKILMGILGFENTIRNAYDAIQGESNNA